MKHFGIICLEATGHLNTMFPLGRELQRRGHSVTIFSSSGAQMKAQAAGFNFCNIYSPTSPVVGGETQKQPLPASSEKLRGLALLRYTLQKFAQIAETRLQKSPAIIKEHGVDALLVDLSVFEGGTIADYLNLPYITVCCLPGNPLVVKYAPQLELLQKASLNITHAGLNTTLESLSYGVPMVAIPVTDDQPGVAARIAWTGAGEFVPLSRLSVPRLRKTIKRVLTKESYKQNALRLQEDIRSYEGVSRAVDIIEQAVSIGKPVIN